jgi:hypothetical protein
MTLPPSNGAASPSPAQKEIEAVTALFVQHPYLVEAHKKVRQALMLPEGYGVLLVVGPPGVGKSALASACRAADPSVSASSLPALGLSSSQGAIPIVLVAARTGTTFLSRWKALLLDILKVTNLPLTDSGKGSDPSAPVLCGRGFETFSIPRLESAVIESLRYRKTVGVLVDEAQDLAPFDSASDSTQMAKSLKHLGSVTETVLVMFGSYSLLNFLDLEAQLSRRCSVVHFPRYDVNKPADSANFQRVLSTFCSAAPMLLPYPQISQEFPLVYTGSAGGTGNLRLWLVRAIGNAILAGAPCVTATHLRAEILADITIRQVLEAAQSGEALFGKLYSALDATIASVFSGVPLPTSTIPTLPGHRRQPGKRSPHRDPITAAA